MFSKYLHYFSCLLMAALAFTSQCFAQALPNHYTRTNFSFAPSSSYDGGLVGFVNPANLAFLKSSELNFFWSNEGKETFSIEDWGAFWGTPNFGSSILRQHIDGVAITDYKLSLAGGNRSLGVGLSYGWSGKSVDGLSREKHFSFGWALRPSKYLSWGFVANQSVQSSEWNAVTELGIRPFGSSGLTLFADAAIRKGLAVKEAPWSAGAALEVISGLSLVGRYFESQRFTLGVRLDFGKAGLGRQAYFDKKGRHASYANYFRVGELRKSIFIEKVAQKRSYVPLNMSGKIDYLTYKLLDKSGPEFFDLIKDIHAARTDPRVGVIALNLAEIQIRPEHAWEVRRALEEFKKAGKFVIAFIERPGMTGYHLASVADRIICDPTGSVSLDGYALSRTYFKGALQKMGVGFDEWRYFKYKSANESFSRENMSDADREQLTAFLDDWYETTRSDVCKSRSLSADEFDRMIDQETHFLAQQAVKSGLVDTLGRWSNVEEILTDFKRQKFDPLQASDLIYNARRPAEWGSPGKVAIVYGLGVCAMNSGIKARWLDQVFRTLANEPSVKAVVFRVDSPGGDGMASDVVDEAIQFCKEKKPVIVSQGQVAGSGGYWISMNADKIFAGPSTITGSIGVIWGWVYDAGIGEKLGMTSDIVTRGAHADLGRGIRFPILNVELPARQVTDEERETAKKIILTTYNEFVEKVAKGRKRDKAYIEKIAQGRIYSGLDGKELGLVDEIGGLWDAINEAKKQAGLSGIEDVELVQIPESLGFIDLQKLISPFGTKLQEDQNMQTLKLWLEKNGVANPVIMPGNYPDFER